MITDTFFIQFNFKIEEKNRKYFLKQAYNSAYYEKMKLVNINSFATRILRSYSKYLHTSFIKQLSNVLKVLCLHNPKHRVSVEPHNVSH